MYCTAFFNIIAFIVTAINATSSLSIMYQIAGWGVVDAVSAEIGDSSGNEFYAGRDSASMKVSSVAADGSPAGGSSASIFSAPTFSFGVPLPSSVVGGVVVPVSDASMISLGPISSTGGGDNSSCSGSAVTGSVIGGLFLLTGFLLLEFFLLFDKG